MTEATVTQ